MNDAEIEKILSEKKFISKRDIELIRKQAVGNDISFKVAIKQFKRISLGMLLLKLLFILIGIMVFITGDQGDLISYFITVVIVIFMMYIVAPIKLGAKLFFVSLKG